MSAIEQLLRVAGEYRRATGLETKTVSWRVFEDSKKLEAMERGDADIQTRRFERAMSWLSENWPADAVWPADVKRPPAAGPEEAAA